MVLSVIAASVPRHDIFVTGVVLVFVEVFSIVAGSFLSERSTEECLDGEDTSLRLPFIKGQ